MNEAKTSLPIENLKTGHWYRIIYTKTGNIGTSEIANFLSLQMSGDRLCVYCRAQDRTTLKIPVLWIRYIREADDPNQRWEAVE